MSCFDPGELLPDGPPAPAAKLVDAEPRRRVEVTGMILSVATVDVGGSPTVRVVLGDGSGEIDLLFLGRRCIPGLVAGACCTAAGTVAARAGRLVVWNPNYRLEPGLAC